MTDRGKLPDLNQLIGLCQATSPCHININKHTVAFSHIMFGCTHISSPVRQRGIECVEEVQWTMGHTNRTLKLKVSYSRSLNLSLLFLLDRKKLYLMHWFFLESKKQYFIHLLWNESIWIVIEVNGRSYFQFNWLVIAHVQAAVTRSDLSHWQINWDVYFGILFIFVEMKPVWRSEVEVRFPLMEMKRETRLIKDRGRDREEERGRGDWRGG